MLEPEQDPEIVVEGLENLIGMMIDDTHIYWAANTSEDGWRDGYIASLPKEGGAEAVILYEEADGISSFTLDRQNSSLYWRKQPVTECSDLYRGSVSAGSERRARDRT